METPRVDGLKVGNLLGYGGCGRVYRAEDESGGQLALKLFDDPSINRPLLEQMTLRLEAGGWPAGVLRVMAADFGTTMPCHVTRLVADLDEKDRPVPRSLQYRLDEHPGLESWKVVKGMARALAGMHARKVVHGNLKPGNVFIDDEGNVLLSDWTLGNMPGVREFHFTDAVLYQAPEQLRDASGYSGEWGCRWDVFSFGVLAFRMLTGRFPRCHETFKMVAPPTGETRREGLKADLSKIANNLEADAEVAWPDEAMNTLEAGFRKWIDRCLLLDPRRASAHDGGGGGGVRGGGTGGGRGKGPGRADGLAAQGGAALVARLVRARCGGGARGGFRRIVAVEDQAVGGGTAGAQKELANFTSLAEQALVAQDLAEKEAVGAVQSLAYERDLWTARLEGSRLISDRLFAWAMEKGHRRLPALDGRELRLKRLERYFEDFLTRTGDVEALADERARVRLQLSEVSLAAGDADGATRRLDEALKSWGSLPMDADFKFRVATDSLLLALLHQTQGHPETEASFVAARKAFGEVPRTEVDTDRLDQLLAILDFHEAGQLAGTGDDTRALEQLMRATQTLNQIAEKRPDATILRSELAACYLSSATILEGIGSLGDAREVRTLASAELKRLLEETPDDPALRLELAGCYGSMAEAAVLSGDIAGAESLSRETLALLDGILLEQPDNAEAVSRKAAQLGLRAGIRRDRGLAAEANKDFDEGIRMLEAVRASAPGDAMVSYRLALLWWQKGRMLGTAGNRAEEIVLIQKSKDLLGQLEAGRSSSGPRPEQLQRSGAYLLGDLGHSLQLAGRKEEAAKVFAEAVTLWEGLFASRPQSEEYSEGLAWCRQRLGDIR